VLPIGARDRRDSLAGALPGFAVRAMFSPTMPLGDESKLKSHHGRMGPTRSHKAARHVTDRMLEHYSSPQLDEQRAALNDVVALATSSLGGHGAPETKKAGLWTSS
jgi:hypothetical protein